MVGDVLEGNSHESSLLSADTISRIGKIFSGSDDMQVAFYRCYPKRCDTGSDFDFFFRWEQPEHFEMRPSDRVRGAQSPYYRAFPSRPEILIPDRYAGPSPSFLVSLFLPLLHFEHLDPLRVEYYRNKYVLHRPPPPIDRYSHQSNFKGWKVILRMCRQF